MEFAYGLAGAVVGALLTALILARNVAARRAVAVEEAERTARTRVEAEAAAARAAADARAAELATRERLAGEREARNAQREARNDDRERQLGERERQFGERDGALAARAEALDRKGADLDQRDARLRAREEAIAARERDSAAKADDLARRAMEQEAAAAAAEGERRARLAEVAGLTPEQARERLLAGLESELAAEQGLRILAAEKRIAEAAKEKGIEIISRAIQRYAAEHTAATTSVRIPLPDADYKGRIIGKEGRNIKAFEQAAGVDVILVEDEAAVEISCFDPVRREIARRALALLVEDGRIHPARIEEVLALCGQEIDREALRHGEEAALACEVSGLHPQLQRLLGKLHWRTSYGQNVLAHSREVAFLCAAMAADLGLDPRLARRCGLLHDVGKALDHEHEGSHPVLGHQALLRYGESETVANAALAHHEGHEVLTPYTTLAAAADAISAARPGARHHTMENHLKRVAQVEEIALGFTGVQRAYAIQGGRELRVIVDAAKVADEALIRTARDIARRIEDQVRFPGEIKVTIIREQRGYAVAR
ncbi:MAG: Ribonuclease [Planctomycetota bacterium]